MYPPTEVDDRSSSCQNQVPDNWPATSASSLLDTSHEIIDADLDSTKSRLLGTWQLINNTDESEAGPSDHPQPAVLEITRLYTSKAIQTTAGTIASIVETFPASPTALNYAQEVEVDVCPSLTVVKDEDTMDASLWIELPESDEDEPHADTTDASLWIEIPESDDDSDYCQPPECPAIGLSNMHQTELNTGTFMLLDLDIGTGETSSATPGALDVPLDEIPSTGSEYESTDTISYNRERSDTDDGVRFLTTPNDFKCLTYHSAVS